VRSRLVCRAHGIREAKRRKEDFIITDGGSRWTASGTDGCIARVNFPAPALLSHIATEDETFDKVLALAGESLDDLFESRHYLKPTADFRDKAADALPSRSAARLIELCQVGAESGTLLRRVRNRFCGKKSSRSRHSKNLANFLRNPKKWACPL
jgi:hypothetical protein